MFTWAHKENRKRIAREKSPSWIHPILQIPTTVLQPFVDYVQVDTLSLDQSLWHIKVLFSKLLIQYLSRITPRLPSGVDDKVSPQTKGSSRGNSNA